jgi:crossover junction endodeoxyribonuclease RuvC
MKLFVGIDCGAISGAWGIIDHNGKYWSCGDIPNQDGQIKARMFRAELMQAIDRQDAVICIEDVHSMPGQGVASSFKFGRAVGAINAVADLIFGVWHIVSPQRWKRAMGVTQEKDSSLKLARELWPNAPLTRKKDHGRAEALLIAEYLRRTHG